MSLRKQARILGIAPSYLSMLVNGKRKWPDDLRYRYQELVNSVVNTERKAAYEITGAQEGTRTPWGWLCDQRHDELSPWNYSLAD